MVVLNQRHGRCRETTHSIFMHVQEDGILDPGNNLKSVHQAHDEIHTHNHDKPQEEFIAPLVFSFFFVLLRTAHKWSGESERDNVHKGADTLYGDKYHIINKEWNSVCQAYRKNKRRYFFSTNTRKKGHSRRGDPSSPSSSASLSPNSCRLTVPPSSAGMTEASS